MKKAILGLLGLAIVYNSGLCASQSEKKLVKHANETQLTKPKKDREAFQQDSVAKDAIAQVSAFTKSAEILRNRPSGACLEAQQPALPSSTDAIKAAMLEQEYACFPHGSNVGRRTVEGGSTGSSFHDSFYGTRPFYDMP